MSQAAQALKITNQEFDLFKNYIEQECGIHLDDDKVYLLESRLRSVVEDTESRSFGELFRKIKEEKLPLLRAKVIDAITTNETLWFRDNGPYLIFSEVFLPRMAALLSRGKPKVKIWSAACSTGQEPYSIAMMIDRFCKDNPSVHRESFQILATDISAQALSVARLGAYDGLSMSRGMSDDFKQSYFRQNDRFWIIDQEMKKGIEFKEYNLLGGYGPLGTFDAIFCRNVAIYFSQEVKQELFNKMKSVLHPEGIFLLGTSETLTYYATDFKPKEYQNYTYYEA